MGSVFNYVACLPPPIRLGVNQYPVETPSSSPTPPTGHTWDTGISDVLRKEAELPLSDPLEGWPTSEQAWVASIGRQVYSDNVFSVDLSTLPRHHTRSETDILTMAMKHVRAAQVPNEDFLALE